MLSTRLLVEIHNTTGVDLEDPRAAGKNQVKIKETDQNPRLGTALDGILSEIMPNSSVEVEPP